MISDARGKHVSPGLYMDERDVVYTPKSVGSTSLGLVGETLYGPAFQNVEIQDWGEFLDYFGGTSTEKMPIGENGTDYAPKYQLPYIAKNYLKESKKLNVVRVLGLSGYKAGNRFDIKETSGSTVNLLGTLRSYVDESSINSCDNPGSTPINLISNVSVSAYTKTVFTYGCNGQATVGSTGEIFNKFKLTVSGTSDTAYNKSYNVSLNPNDSDYIGKVLTPETGLYVEGIYGLQTVLSGSGYTISASKNSEASNDFEEPYRPAVTPWFVSEATVDYTVSGSSATTNAASVKKLFKLVTISDGDNANYLIKVSIQNVNPVSGTFDVVVRDFNDTDRSPVILEKFRGCTMNLGETSYIGYKIGTIDGRFISKSKYISVLLYEDVDLSGSVPCGFLGYPVFSGTPEIKYDSNLESNANVKNHFFGINTNKNFFADILAYKGKDAYDNDNYDNDPTKLSAGFHMDAVFADTALTNEKITVDGVTGFKFVGATADAAITNGLYPQRLINDEGYLKKCIYKDMNNRKFTVCFYGGFDGWDINRDGRTNTDSYKSTKYLAVDSATTGYKIFDQSAMDGHLNLPKDAITSDYYAYLAGYNVFANPEDVQINIIATPGIDWYNNRALTQEVIDLIEDTEKRRGDAIYVMDSPNGYDAEELADMFADAEINSSYACTFYPWVLYKDAPNKQYIELSATKDVVRDMAYTDKHYETWFAPAGTKRGSVDCEKAVIKTVLTDEDALYGNMVNPIKTFAKDGVKIWGNKTAYPVESPLNRINVRRLMIWLKSTINDASKDLIFDQYDESLEDQFRDIVEPKLLDVKKRRGIYDFIIQTENTPETRDEHILPAKVLIKPTPTLEYISLSFVIYPESVEFDEN